MRLEIRRGLPSEADALSALARRAKASWPYPDAWIRAWEEDLRFTNDTFERCTVLVAARGEQIAGVVAFSCALEERSGEIEHLWVDPSLQGQGIGRALMGEALAGARELGIERLRVESDPNARAFYEHLGAVYRGEAPAPVLGSERTLPVLELGTDPRATNP